MMNIKVFDSPEFGAVRTITRNGEIAFVAKDVLERLGIDVSNVGAKIAHVPDEWRGRHQIATPSGTQDIDMAIRERVIDLPVPKNYCLPYFDEPLAPEVGGRIYVEDYNGNEVAVEMATVPTTEKGGTGVITIPLNTNSGIRLPARRPPEKPERKQTENIERIGVSIPQAAKLLDIDKPLMAHLVKTEKVRAVKLGKRVVVSVQSLRDFVDGRKAPDNSPENNAELQGKKE